MAFLICKLIYFSVSRSIKCYYINYGLIFNLVLKYILLIANYFWSILTALTDPNPPFPILFNSI